MRHKYNEQDIKYHLLSHRTFNCDTNLFRTAKQWNIGTTQCSIILTKEAHIPTFICMASRPCHSGEVPQHEG